MYLENSMTKKFINREKKGIQTENPNAQVILLSLSLFDH